MADPGRPGPPGAEGLQQPFSRARGRARARAVPRTQEELDALQRLGSSLAAGRAQGRGRSGGRGVTPDRQPGPGSVGRAGTGPGVGRASSGAESGGSVAELGQEVEQLGVTEGPPSSSSTNGHNGNGASLGRGQPMPVMRGVQERRETTVIRTRPDQLENKQGTQGIPVNLSANFFKIISKPEWRLFKSRVDFEPEQEETRQRKALVISLTDQLPKFIFDGTVMFTETPVGPDSSQPVQLTATTRDGGVVLIRIRLVEELQPSDFHFTQFFNILLRKVMEGMRLQLVGRNYYDPNNKIELRNYKIELWPGYVTSIRQHEEDVLLCCEISHKVLRTDTVLEQMKKIIDRFGRDHQRACEKELLGEVVMTRYNNKTYRIDDIVWDQNPTSTFEWRGVTNTFKDYYEEKYNRALRDMKQPLLAAMPTIKERRQGVSGPVLLVPELCNMTGLSDEMRANFNLMKEMGNHTRQEPATRVRSLQTFANRIAENQETKKMLEEWKLAFNRDLVQLRARLMEPVEIRGAGSSKFKYKVENADWSPAFRNWKQWTVVECKKWAVIHPPNAKDSTLEFIQAMDRVAPSLGMILGKPKLFETIDTRNVNYVTLLDEVINKNPVIVMVVIPNNKSDHYASIKKKCCIERPIPSQVMTATVLSKPKGLMSVATKVAIQMNCKLGGEPWTVKIPLENTMIVGFDTYHDTLHKEKSVGALVCTINASFTRFYSSAVMHSNFSEMSSSIAPLLLKALRKYQNVNKGLPERVIMYRDGVGDGQIPYLLDHEIAALENLFSSIGMEGIKFTFLVVNKRINSRFFKHNGGGPTNPPSGTIVDDIVTLPERYDFFIVSQSVRQGTVNPTSYNVLKDTSGLKPEHLQTLTYRLTHLYFNWPGTVRVPAVVQYSHKLAFLVGNSLHTCPTGLEDKLYYL